MLLACALLFLNATISNAQTPYAQLTFNYDYVNSFTSGGDTYDYWTTRIDFYEDAECTIPTDAPYGVTINFWDVGRTNCGSKSVLMMYSTPVWQVEGFHAFHSAVYNWSTYQTDHTVSWLELKPGTGYLVAPSVGGPDECY